MVVYGDPASYRAFESLIEEFSILSCSIRWDSLDEVRQLLIQAGQIEQGLADAEEDNDLPAGTMVRIQAMTDWVAHHFCGLFLSPPPVLSRHAPPQFLSIVQSWQQASVHGRERVVRIKVPEGFAYYALYPEQYAMSAREWARCHPARSQDILVIGLRSIGTTLSAVVMATLKTIYPNVCRITVRPKGHPFRREIRIAPEHLTDRSAVLIVDEGPGASGSSMASAANEVAQAGIRPGNIYFFPGHANPPGEAASSEIRLWWNHIAKIVTPIEEITWNGASLEQRLLKEAAPYSPPGGGGYHAIMDVSGGEWRRHAFEEVSLWPPVCARFERRKFLCEDAHGNKLLWKFTGLAPQRSSSDPFSSAVPRPHPWGTCCGFTARAWIQGTRLTKAMPANSRLIRQCSAYLADSQGPNLHPQNASESRQRLADMLLWNIQEALGKELAEKTQALLPEEDRNRAPLPSYTDGRMAPYEWVINPQGILWKIHDWGRDSDHTIIGCQSILWDVAGFLVEWDLPESSQQVLLDTLKTRGLPLFHAELRFYQLAYTAFRLGQTSFCASMESGPEKQRLAGAAEAYQQHMVKLIGQSR